MISHTLPSIMLPQHRRGGSGVTLCVLSSVCRCCYHSNCGWKCLSESWVDSRFTLCPEIRSWSLQGPWGYCVGEAGEMSTWTAQLFYWLRHSAALGSVSVTPVSVGLPLKIREQLSPDYLILRQIPRIPVTELSWGWYREEWWSEEPFKWVGVHIFLFWTVTVFWQRQARVLVSQDFCMKSSHWRLWSRPPINLI